MFSVAETVARDGVRARLRLKLVEVDQLALTWAHREVVRYVLRMMIRFGTFDAYLKHEQIAKAVGCSVRTVQRAFAQCLKLGFLSWRQRSVAWARGGRRLLANLYAVVDSAKGSNCSDRMSDKRLDLFKLRLKREEGASATPVCRHATVQDEPLMLTAALLRTRIVNKR